MNQLPQIHQKKQKILNYEIRLIQECNDTLFNCPSCSHHRYLEWDLPHTVTKAIGSAPHRLRWIGADRQAPLYAYIYIAITACSKESSLMVELKSGLYALAEKYLAVFEQKLLIEFLCLLEYSHQKHLFFRKYASIERILLRLFGEVERRAPIGPHVYSLPQHKENTFSKLTTCITSPCRSHQDARSDRRNDELSNIKPRWMWLLEVYSRQLPFVRANKVGEAIMKVTVEIGRTNSHQDYFICVEKECFFVVEMGEEVHSHLSIRSGSTESQQPHNCQQCLKRSSREKLPTSSRHSPREITSKLINKQKKVSLEEPNFSDEKGTNKNINVEVLNVAEYQEKAPIESDARTTLLYKKRIDNLANINATIKSIDLEKVHQQYPDFRSRPHPTHFPSRERQVHSEQALPQARHFQYPTMTTIPSNQPPYKPLFAKKYVQQPPITGKLRSDPTMGKQNPENRAMKSSDKKKKQTLLSANNLRRFIKPPAGLSTTTMRMHSHSPCARPSALSPLKARLPLLHPVKFTYY